MYEMMKARMKGNEMLKKEERQSSVVQRNGIYDYKNINGTHAFVKLYNNIFFTVYLSAFHFVFTSHPYFLYPD